MQLFGVKRKLERDAALHRSAETKTYPKLRHAESKAASRTLAAALQSRARFVNCMAGKILSREDLFRERERLRADGKVLVFTNGVFDLLHLGHVRYLDQARALGDALAVAINSDRSVRQLKGEGRPVVPELERAEVLAALRPVSYVTIFDDVSPRELIATLLPDVLVKGGDYAVEEIHGAKETLEAGGRVISLPFVPGSSTTAMVERLKLKSPAR